MLGGNPPDINAFTAAAAVAAAAAGAMTPAQLASMKMFASMTMNIGVNVGRNMARLEAMGLTGEAGMAMGEGAGEAAVRSGLSM